MILLSGNEAIAQGSWEAGAHIGTGYPGTPSTEAMECFAAKHDVYAQWCPNEKVALEVALGASAAGARVLVTMKHVGVNVAADPLFTAAYTGVGGGMLIMAADDPGMHSSQNEQDSRFYACSARLPMFEPADSQEALDFTRAAFGLSERFDLPFMIRSTVRVSHTLTLVRTGEREPVAIRDYTTDPAKWVMMPAYAKPRRTDLDRRVALLSEWVEECPFNRVEPPVTGERTAKAGCHDPLEAYGGSVPVAMTDAPGNAAGALTREKHAVGIICSGAVYQHVREAIPEATIFKLGVVWPLPQEALKGFAASVGRLFVVDEASDYLSSQVGALGIELERTPFPLTSSGELTPRLIAQAFGKASAPHRDAPISLPGRPPALCPGCPHRLVFKELARMKAIVCGDIGCYTLGALPPLSAMDTCVDMGASISMAHGFGLASSLRKVAPNRPVVAVIGDSTFAHSGISSLMNTIYNQGNGIVAILDNRTTAMTGRQGNPFNGQTLQGRETRELDFTALLLALGVQDVRVVDPHDSIAVRTALKDAALFDGLSVLLFRAPCVLLERKREEPFVVKDDCRACGACTTLGCPALSRAEDSGKAVIDASLCIGCSQCGQYCAFSSIVRSPTNGKGLV
jgi:indolepyruvate ferredoxin oxidoreductase alpha subunit